MFTDNLTKHDIDWRTVQSASIDFGRGGGQATKTADDFWVLSRNFARQCMTHWQLNNVRRIFYRLQTVSWVLNLEKESENRENGLTAGTVAMKDSRQAHAVRMGYKEQEFPVGIIMDCPVPTDEDNILQHNKRTELRALLFGAVSVKGRSNSQSLHRRPDPTGCHHSTRLG